MQGVWATPRCVQNGSKMDPPSIPCSLCGRRGSSALFSQAQVHPNLFPPLPYLPPPTTALTMTLLSLTLPTPAPPPSPAVSTSPFTSVGVLRSTCRAEDDNNNKDNGAFVAILRSVSGQRQRICKETQAGHQMIHQPKQISINHSVHTFRRASVLGSSQGKLC